LLIQNSSISENGREVIGMISPLYQWEVKHQVVVLTDYASEPNLCQWMQEDNHLVLGNVYFVRNKLVVLESRDREDKNIVLLYSYVCLYTTTIILFIGHK
jgi:hypothetical protein